MYGSLPSQTLNLFMTMYWDSFYAMFTAWRSCTVHEPQVLNHIQRTCLHSSLPKLLKGFNLNFVSVFGTKSFTASSILICAGEMYSLFYTQLKLFIIEYLLHGRS
jgi:hypothetical protein